MHAHVCTSVCVRPHKLCPGCSCTAGWLAGVRIEPRAPWVAGLKRRWGASPVPRPSGEKPAGGCAGCSRLHWGGSGWVGEERSLVSRGAASFPGVSLWGSAGEGEGRSDVGSWLGARPNQLPAQRSNQPHTGGWAWAAGRVRPEAGVGEARAPRPCLFRVRPRRSGWTWKGQWGRDQIILFGPSP